MVKVAVMGLAFQNRVAGPWHVTNCRAQEIHGVVQVEPHLFNNLRLLTHMDKGIQRDPFRRESGTVVERWRRALDFARRLAPAAPAGARSGRS